MSRRTPILCAGLFLAATVAAPTPAMGQPSSPPPAPSASEYPACTPKADSEDGKKKYIAARQDYDEGNYDSALKRFKDAYNIDCKPELLLLISSTYERKGDRQQALTALELFVQRAPKDSPELPTTQQKIENLKKQIAAQPPPPPPPPPPPEMQEHTIWPWVVVGTGVAAVGVGVVFVATTPSFPSQCNRDTGKCTPNPGQTQDDPDFVDAQSRAGSARDQPTIGAVIIASGAALVVGGLVWHFLEPTGPKERARGTPGASRLARLAPSVGPGFAGLSCGGSF